MSLTIRDATDADSGAVAELLAELGYPVTGEEAAGRLARDGERVMVAESGGRVLGLVATTISWPLTHPRPVARVTTLVVGAGSRRLGVGRLLMRRAARDAAMEGCEGIELTSANRPEREAAHQLYESLGYVRTSHRFWKGF